MGAIDTYRTTRESTLSLLERFDRVHDLLGVANTDRDHDLCHFLTEAIRSDSFRDLVIAGLNNKLKTAYDFARREAAAFAEGEAATVESLKLERVEAVEMPAGEAAE